MFEHKIDEAQRMNGYDPRDFIPIEHHPKEWLGSTIFSIFAWPTMLFAGFYYFNKFISKRFSGGVGGFGVSNLVGQGKKLIFFSLFYYFIYYFISIILLFFFI